MITNYKRFIGKVVRVEWLDHVQFNYDVDERHETGLTVMTTIGLLDSIGKDYLKVVWEFDEDKQAHEGLFLMSNCIKSLVLVTKDN